MTNSIMSNDREPLDMMMAMSPVSRAVHNLPFWPKMGVVINFNAAIWTAIAIIIISVVKKYANAQDIVDLSNLMVCFFVGAVVAVISISFDALARKLYELEITRRNTIARWADVFDFSAFGVMLASIGIFIWGLWWGTTILQKVLF